MACFFGLLVNAQTQSEYGSANADRPMVLVLSLGKTEQAIEREKKFITQLALCLDQFQVHVVTQETDKFLGYSSAGRLAFIQPLSEKYQAVATFYLEETKANLTLLNLVALNTGQAIVRVVETSKGPGEQLDLALAAQELLGKAYLPSTAKRDNAVENVVVGVTQRAVSKLGDPYKAGFYRKTHLVLVPAAAIRMGMLEEVGPSFLVGGGLNALLFVTNAFLFKISAIPMDGMEQVKDFGSVAPWGVDLSIAIGYLWRFGMFGVGPVLEFGAPWSKVDVNLKTTGGHSFAWWNFRVAVSSLLFLEFNEILSLIMEPGIGVYPLNREFNLVSSGEEVYRTARIDFGFMLGMGISI